VSDYEATRRAREVIAAADRGDYDELLGITPEQRALLTRATGDGPMAYGDVVALAAIHRDDLIAAAYDAGRINLDTQEN
jgi:hypothetical protein